MVVPSASKTPVIAPNSSGVRPVLETLFQKGPKKKTKTTSAPMAAPFPSKAPVPTAPNSSGVRPVLETLVLNGQKKQKKAKASAPKSSPAPPKATSPTRFPHRAPAAVVPDDSGGVRPVLEKFVLNAKHSSEQQSKDSKKTTKAPQQQQDVDDDHDDDDDDADNSPCDPVLHGCDPGIRLHWTFVGLCFEHCQLSSQYIKLSLEEFGFQCGGCPVKKQLRAWYKHVI
jgi:hypothetical protein